MDGDDVEDVEGDAGEEGSKDIRRRRKTEHQSKPEKRLETGFTRRWEGGDKGEKG